MILMLMRHGPAESARPGRSDRERPLTPEGARLLGRQAAALRRAGVRVEQVLTSPYRRALQTAELIGPAVNGPVTVYEPLGCGCTLRQLDDVLHEAGRPERVLIVGHQPDLGQIIHALTGAQAAVRPGTLAVLETAGLRPNAGLLHGLYDPALLAGIAEPG